MPSKIPDTAGAHRNAPLGRIWFRLQTIWLRLPLAVAVLLLVLPVLALMWTLMLKELSQRQGDLQREHEDRIDNVTQISAQALNSLLLSVDQTLLDLRAEWARRPGHFPEAVEQRRRTAMATLGLEIHMSVIDAEGRIRYSSLNPADLGRDSRREKHFTLPRDTQVDRIFVSTPLFTPAANRLLMPYSRRLLPQVGGPSDAAFNGVIVFWVSPDFVTRIYKTTRFHSGSTFTWMDLNTGQLLLRHIKRVAEASRADPAPADQATLMAAQPKPDAYINAILLSRARQLPATGVGRMRSLLDQAERTYAWHKFETVPFALIVGEPTSLLKDAQAQLRWRYLSTGLLVSLLLTAAVAGTLSTLRTRARAASRQARQIQEMAQQQTELAQSREHLRRLGQHLATVRENERQRIAQNLHDELGQRLSVLRLTAAQMVQQLGDAEQGRQAPIGGIKPALSGLKAQIDDTIAVVREIAEDLRPSALTVGLQPAIESLCDQFQRVLGMPSQIHIHLAPDAPLSLETATVAYRIVQESLTNVMRHARATQFKLTLDGHDGWLHLRVSDNGTGFTPGSPSTHTFGLLGMQERANAIGGEVQVHTLPGLGTHVKARLPLQPLPPEPAPSLAGTAATHTPPLPT